MDLFESKMINLLCDLKENYHVCSIKSEFETEGATLEEVMYLKNLVSSLGLDLTLKIGGAEAIRDIRDAKNLEVNAIVAPMIETPYALHKFSSGINKIFSEEEQKNIKFLINIETKSGFDNSEEILSSDDAQIISGIVLGRTDLTGSLGLMQDCVDNKEVFEYAQMLALKSAKYGKEFIIGGGVTSNSLLFFKRLPFVSKIETQKVIFNSDILNLNEPEKALIKAFEFELLWIKNKQNLFGSLTNEDIKRIKLLESRYNASVPKTAVL